jgi:hypothetical protein
MVRRLAAPWDRENHQCAVLSDGDVLVACLVISDRHKPVRALIGPAVALKPLAVD